MLRWSPRGLAWGFWALLLCVAVLSLMPAAYLPAQVFSLWDKARHALAFTALATLGLLAYPRQPWRVVIAMVLIFSHPTHPCLSLPCSAWSSPSATATP